MNFNDKVTEYINKAPESQQENLKAIRTLVHQSVTDVSEEIKWGFPVFGSNKDFAYMRAAKSHTTLGFYNFHRINDVGNILEGEGNTMRHIKVRAIRDLNKEQLSEWLAIIAAE